MFQFESCGFHSAIGPKPHFSESWAHFDYEVYLNLFSNSEGTGGFLLHVMKVDDVYKLLADLYNAVQRSS